MDFTKAVTHASVPPPNRTESRKISSRPVALAGEFLLKRRVGAIRVLSVMAVVFATTALQLPAEVPAELKITGDWEVTVSVREPQVVEAVLKLAPPEMLAVSAEKYDALPLFNPRAGGWVKGAQLRALRAQETTTPYLLEPESLVVRAGAGADAEAFRRGEDYEADLNWGTLGRLAKGRIKEGQSVFVSYRHALLRLDAVVLGRDGRIVVRRGEPRAASNKHHGLSLVRRAG